MIRPDDETETARPENPEAERLRDLRIRNAAAITRQREMAQKWRADHQKNNLLFPASYDFS